MIRAFFSAALAFFTTLSFAQDFSHLTYRNLGPYRGGRVTTVAGSAAQPSTFYLGATGGGVWKTEDFGLTWKNISDGYFSTPSIGGIEVAQSDPEILFVGTGSDGLRSNVIEGRGVYKSTDAGKTWDFIGLKEVGQIGAVRIHPENPDVVYVAAIGKAFKPNKDRGVFKTTDGGKTWEKILYVSEQTGFSDIEFHPANPEVIYATAWKAERKPWTIISGGSLEEGGIYTSENGGKTWKKLKMDLPSGLIGKIDLAVTPASPDRVYALVEAPGEEGGLYISEKQGKKFERVSSFGGIRTRPFYYTNIRVDPKDPEVIYSLATGYYKSTDGGKEWNRVSSPHGDNHDMWINPENPDIFIQSNDGGANITQNGGKTWSTQFNQPTAEIYQVEVDDQYPYWVYGGQQDNYSTIAVPSQAPYGVQQDGTGFIVNTGGCETGPAVPKPGNHNIVYANCKGKFGVYDKRTGMEMQYYVGAANMYGHNPRDLKYRFQRVSPIHVSPHDPNTVYHTSQYVHRSTDEGKTWETISPDLTAFEDDKQVISGSPITRDITGEEFYSTIYSIRESPLQQGLIWVGANDGPVHLTRDGGKTWVNVTPEELPEGGRVDAVEPSPHNPAKAYISVLRYQLGDAKPYLYKTQDYGQSWTLASSGIPDDFPVRVVREDPVQEGLLFAGTEYGMFVSFDDGKEWKPFQLNLPVTPITDLKVHRGDLAISTMGRGFWVLDDISSLRQWNAAQKDKLYAPRDTYRFRFPSRLRNNMYPRYPRASVNIDYHLSSGGKEPVELTIQDEAGNIVYHVKSGEAPKSNEERSERDMATEEIRFFYNRNLTAKKGMNRFNWYMDGLGAWSSSTSRSYQRGPMVPPGTYTVTLSRREWSESQTFELMMDPRVVEAGVTEEDLRAQAELQKQVIALLEAGRRLEEKLKKESARKDIDKARLGVVKAALAQLQTEEGTYMQPMWLDQVSYLYSMITRADQRPGQDAYDRLEELDNSLDALVGSLE